MLLLQRDLHWDDPFVGGIFVANVSYHQCETCSDQLLPLETIRKIESERVAKLERFLQSRPLSEFMTSKETAQVLGITKQALSKHRRINRGLIFQTKLDGKALYLRESVNLFQLKQDGRFELSQLASPIMVTRSNFDVGFTTISSAIDYPNQELIYGNLEDTRPRGYSVSA
jgi:hypothetical protein